MAKKPRLDVFALCGRGSLIRKRGVPRVEACTGAPCPPHRLRAQGGAFPTAGNIPPDEPTVVRKPHHLSASTRDARMASLDHKNRQGQPVRLADQQ